MKLTEAQIRAPDVNVNNIHQVKFADLMEYLSAFALVEVPNGTRDEGAMERIDELLGYFANVYASFKMLWASATYHTNRAKLLGPTEHAEMNKKKEAIYEVASAVKLKWEAVSRMLTYKTEVEGGEIFEQADMVGRAERAAARQPGSFRPSGNSSNQKRSTGWGGL